MATAMLAAGLTIVAMPAHAAPIDQHTPATYNMEGSNKGAKWTDNVVPFVQNHDVVALQEAGARPDMGDGQTVANSPHGSVQLYRWQAGNSYRNVYYMQTDTGGNQQTARRVNLAIVTPHEADDVVIIPPSFPNGNHPSRPAFGIRIGETIFFTLHGLSGNGNDDRQLLENMRQAAEDLAARDGHTGSYQWAALGDFNRHPSSWNLADDENPDPRLPTLPTGARIYNPNTPTHVHGGVHDYMVAGHALPDDWGGNVPRGLTADHFPVEFGPLPVGHPGRAEDLITAKKGRKGPLGTIRDRVSKKNKPAAGGKNRRWFIRPSGKGSGSRTANIVNQKTGECLGAVAHHPTHPDGKVGMSGCLQGSENQKWWTVKSPEHPGYMSIISKATKACLAVDGEEIVMTRSCDGDDESAIWADVAPSPPGPNNTADADTDDGRPANSADADTGDAGAGKGGSSKLKWDFSTKNETERAKNYHSMIDALRAASGHPFHDAPIFETTDDQNRVLSVEVTPPAEQGQNPHTVTLYFTAHDLVLRGWSNGRTLFQFDDDWDLGQHLNRQATTMGFDSTPSGMRGAWPDVLAESGNQAPQRAISARKIEKALHILYTSGDPESHDTAWAALVIRTVTTGAARYDAVAEAAKKAIGQGDEALPVLLNDTEFNLLDDWDMISEHAHNVTDDPNADPLDAAGEEIGGLEEVANYVSVIKHDKHDEL